MRRCRSRKLSQYRMFYIALDYFGLGMTIGVVLLMFGFVVLQALDKALLH